MAGYVRDATLATVTGAVLIGALAQTGALAVLADPWAVAAGVAGALAVEAAFVLDTPAGRLWERPVVQAGGVLALLGGAAALAWATGPWVLAAACWGLVTYFLLLALVLVGVWGDRTRMGGE